VLSSEEGFTDGGKSFIKAVNFFKEGITKGFSDGILCIGEVYSLLSEELVEPFDSDISLVLEVSPDSLDGFSVELVLKINLGGESLLLVVVLEASDVVSLVGLLLGEGTGGILSGNLEGFALGSDSVGEISAGCSSLLVELSELGCQEGFEVLTGLSSSSTGGVEGKLTGLSPGDPCGFNSLLEGNSLVVELVEELVSVAVDILVVVVGVLEVIKSSLNTVVLGLNISEKGGSEVGANMHGGVHR
jgi:hypothetical protein